MSRGNGKSVSIGTDLWVKDKQNFMLENVGENVRDLKVEQLFQSGAQVWDEGKIRSMFDEEDTDAIQNVPLPRLNMNDQVAWVRSNDGCYSVKSGYHFWQEGCPIDQTLITSTGWKRLWKLQVPSKVKFFLWRFYRNNIPVQAVLQGKGNAIPLTCPMCSNDAGNLLHVFFDCEFASHCWQCLGLVYNMWEVEDVPKWVLEILAVESFDKLIKFAMTLWGIWFFRNTKVWTNKVVTPRFAVEWGCKQLQDWKKATMTWLRPKNDPTMQVPRSAVRLSPPEVGRYKIYVDATVMPDLPYFSLGMVLRDHEGHFLGGRVVKIKRNATVLEAESMRIEEALSWILSKGLIEVNLESDSLLRVNAINSATTYHLEIGHNTQFCRLILASRNDVKTTHVKRLANIAAHAMAKVPCELHCDVEFMSPSRSVLDLIMYDEVQLI